MAETTGLAAAEFPRGYVAAEAKFDEWETAERYYRELAEREVGALDELERWLCDWSELDACFDEEGVAREIAMTRHTDDPQCERRHVDFVENIKPKRAPWHDRLRKKFAAHAEEYELPPLRYEVLERDCRNAIEIFRHANVPLLTEDELLRQRYQKITAAMTCDFDGQERTIQQTMRYLEEPDRRQREQAWRAAAERYGQDRDALNELYDQMVGVRHRIGRNADCGDYRGYAFKAKERFDYTPEDCLAYHDAIEKVVVPAVQRLAEERKKKLAIDTLRPWDLDVDVDHRPPLTPFETDRELAEGCGRIFTRIDPDFGRIFDTLVEREMLDLGSRKGKAPGGYQEMYWEQRMPFIFMNAVGAEDDVTTLLHEGGHAFHSWACRNEPLLPYRRCPLEFAEVASMSMELLAHPHLEEFFGDQAGRARKRHLLDILHFLPWMARVDAFQHYVYANVEHDTDRRLDEWQALRQRFAPHQDWSGLEEHERNSWHRKLHFFQVPFYYIEYGIAQLGALQVWLNAKKDPQTAIAKYRAALTLGGSRPLPELFETAGCKFDFSEATLRPLIEAVMEEVERLGE
ncbi:MAG: M3 family oligoendopeptidase [Planctomycetes bacterium]|nr:M3 family oligoendopeptidase [Planctomycetota bacterium]